MDLLHRLLKRQLKRYFGELSTQPKNWQGFIEVVNEAYIQFDTDRTMLEHSLELSSQELSQANSDMSAVVNSSIDGILAFDCKCRYTVWNTGMESITGVSKREVLGKCITETFPVFTESGEEDALYQSLTGRTIIVKEKSYTIPATGRKGFFEGYYSPLRDESGDIIGGLAIIRDVTKRREAEEVLKKKTALHIRHQEVLLNLAKMNKSDLQTALRVITEADAKTQNVERVSVWLFDESFSGLVCEDLYKMTEEVHEKGMRLEAKQYPRYFKALEDRGTVAAYDACSDPCTSEFAKGYLIPNGITSMMDVPIWLHGKVVGIVCHEQTGSMREWIPEELDFSSSIADMVSIALEASERKKVQEALAEQAVRDTLTGIYNRRYFNHRIKEELSLANRNKYSMAILLCDLDHFKVINDTRGHQVGDQVLKAVAKSILKSTRGSDLVFRWGGDEIVVILTSLTREGVLVTAERIRRGVHKTSAAIQIKVDMSIGVAIYPEHGNDVEALIKLADRALYIAKKGGDHIHIGEEEYTLDENTVKVVFQPLVDVRTNQVIGYEALSRDPQGKVSILGLFNKYNAIGQFNELKCLCFRSQLKAAKEAGVERVFINVDFNVLGELDIIPKPSGIDVVLEISEGDALYDVDSHLIIAGKWREAGYQFAIDDFGAGFISFPLIARMVPDYIKLDRSVIVQSVSSKKFRKFAKDLVLALRNYTKEAIIAEGIETEKELRVVEEMGIYIGQGYYLGRPKDLTVPPKQLDELSIIEPARGTK